MRGALGRIWEDPAMNAALSEALSVVFLLVVLVGR